MGDPRRQGGCMCGAIRFQIDDNPTWNTYCHCESCRRHSGAPVVMLVTCRPQQVSWTGERALYESSPERQRGFCRECGTTLSYEAEFRGSWCALHISSMDHPEEFPPTDHVFHGEALPWMKIDDELTRYDGAKHI